MGVSESSSAFAVLLVLVGQLPVVAALAFWARWVHRRHSGGPDARFWRLITWVAPVGFMAFILGTAMSAALLAQSFNTVSQTPVESRAIVLADEISHSIGAGAAGLIVLCVGYIVSFCGSVIGTLRKPAT